MNRFTIASPALFVWLSAAGMSCGGNVVVDANGTASGAGNGVGGNGSGVGGNGNGAGGKGTGAGIGSSGAGTGASTAVGIGSSGAGTGAGNGSSGAGTGAGNGSSGAGPGAATSGVAASATATSSAVSSSGSTVLDPCGGGPGSLGWIDDMNNGLGRIDPTDGRKGDWYTVNDATAGGTQTPAFQGTFKMTPLPTNVAAPLPGYTMAANTFGSGFDTWGAFMGFDLDNDGITYAAYDASKFKGICFWARVGPRADSGGQTVRMRILDATTTPQGGICDGNATSGPTQCYDGFGANLTLTPEWQVFKFPWALLQQQGWGESAPAITTNKLYSVDFETGAADAFDTWVFGIEFF